MHSLKKNLIVYFLACLSIILLFSPQTWADTNVGGIINTNTTWTKANSPYIVTGNIGVEKNVTLTIESGVQVLVDGYYYIGVKGKIVANGSENEPIVFTTKNSLSNDEYGWQGIQFKADIDGGNTWQGSLFDYVEISHAHRGISSDNGIGISEPVVTITNSHFDTIGYDGIYLWGLPCVIENNYFTNLNIGNSRPGYSFAIDARGPVITRNIIENSKSSGIRGNVNCSSCPNPVISVNRLSNLGGVGIDGTESIVENNSIFNNDIGIIVNSDTVVHYNTIYNNNIGIISEFGNFIISNNNIFSNIQYTVKISSVNDIDVSNNWWGTINQAEINTSIYDYYEDFTLGKVNYIPFLTTIEQNAPIPPPSNLQANYFNGTIDLSWDALNVNDLKGYKIYYGINPYYPYNGNGANQGNSPIDVGNVTNLGITGLSVGNYYFTITAYDNSANGVDDQIEGHESWYATEVIVSLHNLIVSKMGTGNGSVVSSPLGINCGNDCTEAYAHGTSLTLTAIADTNSTFEGWSGCDLTSGNTCTVAMNSNKNITANFSHNCNYSLTININPIGSGTVNKNPDKNNYCPDEQVTLTAIPNTGYNFSSWIGVNSSNGVTAQVTMSSNKTVTANFTQIPVVNYTLSITKVGNGSVKVNGTTHTLPWSGEFSSGTNVQIEAISDSGWGFANWTGDYTGSTNPTTINISGNKNITANFSQNCDRSLTININPSGYGTVTKNPDKANYCPNEQVTLTASPNSGYTFSSWDGVDSNSETIASITMNANRAVTANFSQQTSNEPDISANLLAQEFGNIPIGDSSMPQTLTISNTGSGNLIIGSLSITGNDASQFIKQTDTCSGQTVTPSATCTVNVILSPTSIGSFDSILNIPSNDLDEPNVTVNLKGGSGADITGLWMALYQQCNGTKCKVNGKFNVQNTGNKDALSSLVRFYLSDDDVYNEGDSFLKEAKTGTLKVGKSKSISLSYSFPSGVSATDKYIIAVIDADNTVTEANESNNIIIYGPILRANLTGMWTSLIQQCKGGKCKIKGALNIQNIGYQDAASLVRFYLSDDGVYDEGDMFLKQTSTGTLKVGKSKKMSLSYSFLSGVSATDKYIIAVIDADNSVLEANEGDNNIIYGPLP